MQFWRIVLLGLYIHLIRDLLFGTSALVAVRSATLVGAVVRPPDWLESFASIVPNRGIVARDTGWASRYNV